MVLFGERTAPQSFCSQVWPGPPAALSTPMSPVKTHSQKWYPCPTVGSLPGAGPEPGSLLQSSGTFPLSPHPGRGHLVTQSQILWRGAGRMFAVLGGGEIWSLSLAQLRPLGSLGSRLTLSIHPDALQVLWLQCGWCSLCWFYVPLFSTWGWDGAALLQADLLHQTRAWEAQAS